MRKFAPKAPVDLDPPKDDIIPLEKLKQANGEGDNPCWVAVKGKVYDVSKNDAYRPGGGYHRKDASRALAKTSLKEEDARSKWSDLPPKEQETLNGWVDYFSQRYNIIGIVEGATNTEGGALAPPAEKTAEGDPETEQPTQDA